MRRVWRVTVAGIILASLAASACFSSDKTLLNRWGLQLTFEDKFSEFNWDERFYGAGAKKGTWRTSYYNGWTPDDINNRTLPDNGEEQVYVDKTFPNMGSGGNGLHPYEILKQDVLRMTANPASADMRPHIWDRKYTSGMITSWGSFAQRYGVFEMRARMPKGKGLWVAFWLLNEKRTHPPEIDIFEILSERPDQLYTGIGSKTFKGDPVFNVKHDVDDTSDGYHTYSLDWGPKDIIYYFDGAEVWRTPTPKDVSEKMFMIVNLAVGGNWPGSPDASTVFPAHMDIDWIRVWQRPEYVR